MALSIKFCHGVDCKQIQNSMFGELVYIPPHDQPHLILVSMYTASIDPKQCGTFVNEINTVAPLAAMHHAKRIRKNPVNPQRLQILLCKAPIDDDTDSIEGSAVDVKNGAALHEQNGTITRDGDGDGDYLSQLPEGIVQLLHKFNATTDITIVQVPRYAAPNKELVIQWSKHWPISIKLPHQATIQAMNLSSTDKQHIHHHMKNTLALAQQQQKQTSLSTQQFLKHGSTNACTIVDPATNTVVGQGVDCTATHPLKHAVMVAVEDVATWQRTMWPETHGTHGTARDAAVDGTNGTIVEENGTNEDVKRRKVELHTGTTTVSGTTAHGTTTTAAAAAGTSDPEQQQATTTTNSNTKLPERPYLCTGYDCYILHEPCWMCAMALIHSRLRRVVFVHSDKQYGALGGSGRKLHAEKSLNHHYHVYHLPLLEEEHK